ncbi:conserved hypothetical protein [Talaromyces stipitatus ATCC 10500]|uniref:Rhodopsin domain-containing protein n=1 Tax=Talaromyces stipitatus (strain ATCC 10500 / CBS 375.48 / QM 6759 / NRRL 1006) TaxID=441959 RepID=B8M982_TALSN|nr:uncharacterized protein TSTA_112120 [Talaromyces stipitatus ATCC 10500]EED17377.1 conserved hypothetical protein [Talaromyces stipitatus ATCC 10500]
MDMSGMAMTTTATGMSMPSSTSSSTSSDMSGHTMSMVMTFFISARSSLFTTTWTPTNDGQYAGTCIFLIVLAVILRFLLALRPILESRVWSDHARIHGGGHILHDSAQIEQQSIKAGGTTSVRQVRYDLSSRWAGWRVNDAAGRATYDFLVAGVGYLLKKVHPVNWWLMVPVAVIYNGWQYALTPPLLVILCGKLGLRVPLSVNLISPLHHLFKFTIQSPLLFTLTNADFLSSVFVALYLISCIFVVKRLGIADYLMLLAWVGVLFLKANGVLSTTNGVAVLLHCINPVMQIIDFGFVFSLTYAVGRGFGRHGHDINAEDTIAINKAIYVYNILYDPTSMAAKSSILAFFLRLTREKKMYYWANCAILFIINGLGLVLTIHQVYQCHPVYEVFRLEAQTSESCTNVFLSALASSPYNIFTDVAILVIPIPLLTRIHLPFRQRLILVFTFGVGISVIAIDVVRFASFQTTARDQLVKLNSFHTEDIGNEDYTWYAAFPMMWSAVEVNTTIICACVPSLKPLLARFTPSLIGQPKGTPPAEPVNDERGHTTRFDNPQTVTGEMMDILTGGETQQGGHVTAGWEMRERYPSNIKLLNLLNLRPTKVLKLNTKESIPAFTMVTTLFFLWGFAYGFLDVLGQRFGLAHLGPLRTAGLEASHFGGYLVIPLTVGLLVLKRAGFTTSFITGLYIYAVGVLLFWPAAVTVSFPIGVLSNVIIGSGLGILEMTANLFISICGPLEYAEIRLCISQGMQAVGELLSRLLVSRAILVDVDRIDDVVSLQWTYLAISLFVILLAVLFYYIPVPKASDDELQELSDLREANRAQVRRIPVVYLTLALGVWSQFFMEAGHEANVVGSKDIVTGRTHLSSASDIESIGATLHGVSRFTAAFVLWKWSKPRWVLLITSIFSIAFAIACTATTGNMSTIMSLVIWLTDGPHYPIIFAISLRGTGVHAKTAAAFLAASVVGAVPGRMIRYAASLSIGDASCCVVVAFMSAGTIFPIYLTLSKAARRQVDPIKDEYLK